MLVHPTRPILMGAVLLALAWLNACGGMLDLAPCFDDDASPGIQGSLSRAEGPLPGEIKNPGDAVTLTVELLGVDGDPVCEHPIDWQVVSGNGTVIPAVNLTDDDGRTSTVWMIGSPSGTHAVTASVQDAVPPLSVDFTVTVNLCANAVEFSDDFGPASQWDTVTIYATNATAVREHEMRPTGGNPGGYREMVHDLAGEGTLLMLHLSSYTYDPATQGAVTSIEYAEDGIITYNEATIPGAGVGGGIAIMQGTFWTAHPVLPYGDAWETRSTTITPDSISPTTGIDLSASGGPIRLGYYRTTATGQQPATFRIVHGIDNWSVKLCR